MKLRQSASRTPKSSLATLYPDLHPALPPLPLSWFAAPGFCRMLYDKQKVY